MCRFLFQVDSLLDISQPAYSQLQKLRGTDCANDEVSAVTQATQRPWETRPTRMLLLQVRPGYSSNRYCSILFIELEFIDLELGKCKCLQCSSINIINVSKPKNEFVA